MITRTSEALLSGGRLERPEAARLQELDGRGRRQGLQAPLSREKSTTKPGRQFWEATFIPYSEPKLLRGLLERRRQCGAVAAGVPCRGRPAERGCGAPASLLRGEPGARVFARFSVDAFWPEATNPQSG